MIGLFRERVEHLSATGYYSREGQRSYRFVSEHDRADARPEARLFRALADRLEGYASAPTPIRKVAFRPGAGAPPDSLADVPPRTLEAALEALAKRRAAEALPLVSAVAERGRTKDARKAARRGLYRLEQAGVTPPRAAPKPGVPRGSEKALSAWVSAVDGSGSRAGWVLFGGAFGGAGRLAPVVHGP